LWSVTEHFACGPGGHGPSDPTEPDTVDGVPGPTIISRVEPGGEVTIIDKVRGAISDRPWGVTLGALAQRRVTGQLWLTGSDAKRYCIAFLRGTVVGAASPLVADSVARIALTGHLVSSTEVPAIAREVAASPNRDEIEIVSRIARLSPEQAAALRRRVLIQRTARTFGIERGDYELEDRITMPVAPDIAIDVAAAIFLGARMNLAETRLTSDMRQIGLRFQLRRDAAVDLDRFGFTEAEVPIIAALRAETSLVELDARFREIEPRTAAAIVYALVAADLCQATGGVATGAQPPATAFTPPVVEPAFARAATDEFEPPRSRTVTLEPIKSSTQPSDTARRITRTLPPRPDLGRVKELIAELKVKVDANVDHFTLLGVSPDDPIDTVRSAFVRIVSVLHPEKLPVLPLGESRDAQRAFSRVRGAYAILSDPTRRATYATSLAQRAAAATARQTTPPATKTTTTPPPVGDRPADPLKGAEEAYRRGLVALRREEPAVAVAELTRATELAPNDHNYPAYLAWAKFCAATDKTEVAVDTRKVLQRAVYNSSKPEVAWFFLGRVERMLGRDREAAHHFREVLDLDPNHAEAAAELRFLEPRIAAAGPVRRK
jgi:curved DNA-binding protein CbpA